MRANLSLTQSGSNRCLLQRLFLNLLLRGGPAGTYWRQRNDLVQAAWRHIQRMQKTLTQMNIQLANVLSEVSGVTGRPSFGPFRMANVIRISRRSRGIEQEAADGTGGPF